MTDRAMLRRALGVMSTAHERLVRARSYVCEQRTHEEVPVWVVVAMRQLIERSDDAMSTVRSILDREPSPPVPITSPFSEEA